MHLRRFLNTDYSFFQKAIPLIGWLGLMGHVSFYFILRHGFKYWESWELRGMAALISLSLVFYPKEKALSAWQKAYFEFAMALMLPGLFTIFFLRNGCNVYWFASLVFAGLLHGLMSKPHIFAWSYLLAAGIATFDYMQRFPGHGDLIMTSVQAQLIAFFLGIITVGVKASLEATHEKIMSTQVALAKAENDLKHAEDIRQAYEELKKREELIRVFVRPSLVEEIRSGKDPSVFQPAMHNLAILFCDIRDFTQLTEVLNPYEKQTFLNQYFTMMTHPIVENGGEVDKIMGDCVMGIFPDGKKAVQAAIGMRLELQKFNQKMYAMGQHLIRNGIGIAKGEVMVGNFGSFEKLDRTVIGEAVNIAARLESKTKMYNLDIIVTEDVVNDLGDDPTHLRWIDLVQVKGSTRRLKLFEIYDHQPVEVRKFKDDTRDLFEKALTIYFRKGFKDASRLFKAMLERVPPHLHRPGELMDTILRYYVAHCDAWINDKTGTWEQIEKWDGVHVFFEK
jgi:class 3 adenylate cyclase